MHNQQLHRQTHTGLLERSNLHIFTAHRRDLSARLEDALVERWWADASSALQNEHNLDQQTLRWRIVARHLLHILQHLLQHQVMQGKEHTHPQRHPAHRAAHLRKIEENGHGNGLYRCWAIVTLLLAMEKKKTLAHVGDAH